MQVLATHLRSVPQSRHPEWYDAAQSRVALHVRGNTVNNKSVVRDLSMHRHAVTAVNVSVGATEPWNGPYFASASGIGRLHTTIPAGSLRLTNTNFTLDLIYRTAQTTGVRMLFAAHDGVAAHSVTTSQLLLYINANVMELALYQGGPAIVLNAGGSGAANGRWRHVRVQRVGTLVSLAMDGGAPATTTVSGTLNDLGRWTLFDRNSLEFPMTGDIHACRVTVSARPQREDAVLRQFDWPNGYPPVLAA
jgi:hypothetical protein